MPLWNITGPDILQKRPEGRETPGTKLPPSRLREVTHWAGTPDVGECDCDINKLETKGAPLKDEELKQLIAELINAQTEAFGLVIAAVSQQLDINRLSADLRAQLEAAKTTRAIPPLAIRIATGALAAADAQSALRNPAKH